MDKALYIASSGANQIMFSQAVHSHNLANSSTIGFQADFAGQLQQQLQGDGFPSRVYTNAADSTSNFSKGGMMNTERPLDIAVSQHGMFAVQTSDGVEAYTRAGNLDISPEGLLTTARGDFVLGGGGPITIPPSEQIHIGKDGTISIIPLGSNVKNSINIDRIKTVRIAAADMQKRDDGLFERNNQEPLEVDASISIVSGALESSNVNPIEEMLNIMDLSRNFELQVKMMETLDNNEQMEQHLLEV